MLASLPRRGLLLGLLLGAAASAPAQTQPPRPADHVVLISVDGLRPEFYLEERWPAPMMQRMAQEGAFARGVRGVAPTVTYPSHTTLVTGALPARHGILHNRPFEPDGPSERWYMESSMIRVPTLWDAIRSAGGTSAAISWPVSAGAPITWNLPEFWSATGREGALTGAAANAAALRARSTPGLFEELEAAVGPFPSFYWGSNRSREDLVGAMAGHILERHKPNLLLVHLNQTDYHQHARGREHVEVRLAVAAVDRAIARMVEAAGRAGILGRTAFIVTGDHGFVDVKTRVSPNLWLKEARLRAGAPGQGDWRATFHGGGGSVFLRLRDPNDRATLERVRALLASLPADTRSLFRIVDRAELDRLGADPESPLALAAAPGAYLELDAEGPAVRPGSGGAHGYFPEFPEIRTGFAAWGAGIAAGRSLAEMGLEDVAPTAAALLGIRFRAPDGALRSEIIAPATAVGR